MARKILTIGITINLENYENLRLDVEGEVGDDGDAGDLIAFLDGMLARLGHGDQATAERVEAYRRRVLAMPATVVAAAPGPVMVMREEELRVQARPAPAMEAPEPAVLAKPRAAPHAEARTEAPPAGDEKPVTVRAGPEVKAAKATAAAKAPARAEPAAPQARAPEPRKPAATPIPKEAPKEVQKEGPKEPARPERPAIADGEVACEGCGLSITKNQAKLSRLLTGKSLCKRCMNP
ncbi:MAG TPA: hypothetical protein VMB35_01335 [Methanomicrobiales archaeon]|nr:hypothetical protein [Methanomicrobiales archaeon]